MKKIILIIIIIVYCFDIKVNGQYQVIAKGFLISETANLYKSYDDDFVVIDKLNFLDEFEIFNNSIKEKNINKI